VKKTRQVSEQFVTTRIRIHVFTTSYSV